MFDLRGGLSETTAQMPRLFHVLFSWASVASGYLPKAFLFLLIIVLSAAHGVSALPRFADRYPKLFRGNCNEVIGNTKLTACKQYFNRIMRVVCINVWKTTQCVLYIVCYARIELTISFRCVTWALCCKFYIPMVINVLKNINNLTYFYYMEKP